MDSLIIKRIHPDAVLPQRATDFSAGYDLCACIPQPLTIAPGSRAVIPTGIAMEISQPDIAGFVFGRSGLGIKHGLVPSNAVGVIDADYRGEVMVGLTNHSDTSYTIQPGERIAQLVLMPIFTPPVVESQSLSHTVRGQGGLGSTGR